MAENNTNLPSLFSLGDIESKALLRKVAYAHQALGELKGIAKTIPNQSILLGTLPLQEAKESSEIENIITTHNDLYQSSYATQQFTTHATKEVYQYAEAVNEGFTIVKETGLITLNTIKRIQQILENNDAGFRQQTGTTLKNDLTGEIIYEPPQSPAHIKQLLDELEQFINNSETVDYDCLIKMAIIHHQFESIHPFYDGNGRTGRIINILYLIQQGLLDTPILYLSRYINKNKQDYYRLLQATRVSGDWQDWLNFILDGVIETAKQTAVLIEKIKQLIQSYKQQIKLHAPNIYRHELLNNLFKYPYTKIEFVVADVEVHRNTARLYLNTLGDLGLLQKVKIGKENFYINTALFTLLEKGIA